MYVHICIQQLPMLLQHDTEESEKDKSSADQQITQARKAGHISQLENNNTTENTTGEECLVSIQNN